MDPLLFIHIPKTAGSSLLKSATDIFGGSAIERDYGPEQDYSSALVKKHIYDAETIDEFGFYAAFVGAQKKWLGGHFFSDRYLHLFGAQNSISFVRDPVDRVISEYTYLQHKHDLERPFEGFYQAPEETNKQFRMIGQVPWKAFKLVGSLARYSDCLQLLAEETELPFSENKENLNPNKKAITVSDDVRADIRKWNERDCIFYDEVTSYLTARLDAHKEKQAFCYHDMGFVPGEHVIGWAFYANDNKAVNVGLYINDRLIAETIASEHRPELQQLSTPRAGHNGFRFSLTEYKGTEQIELRARETEQTLLSWTRP